ncbi:MAG TPA: DUF4175 family protein [Vicinamibacterales bacterium]|nr:DUF4175 family protein [Vicinamibacterales bacterium]
MSPQIEVSSFLQAIRRRLRWLTALRAGTSALAGVAIVLGLLAVVSRVARPAGEVLLALTIGAALGAVAWLARALWRAPRAPDDRQLARFVEERRPEFEDALVSAVSVQPGEHPFARAVVADAANLARGIEPGTVVRREELQRAAGRGAAACALLLVAGGASLGPIDRAIDVARVRLFPSRVVIQVEPGDARVLAGRPLTLRAHITGVPDGFDAAPALTTKAGPATTRHDMAREGRAYVLAFPAVQTSFTYAVAAAGARSREYTVTVLHKPALERIEVSYRYPAYTGMPPREEEDGGDIYAPAGTRVTLRVRADKRLSAGTLKLGTRAIALQPGTEARVRETSFVVDRDGSYRVDLTDVDGLRSEPSSEYFVRVTDDRPPEVRILRPEGDRQVTALEEVEIEARAEDDYRLSSLELVYAVGAQPEKVVPLSRAAGASLSGGHLMFMEELKVQPGDMVRAYARAREARKGGRETRSEMLLLEVTPFDQQFSLAQSQAAGAGGGGGDMDSLIQAQKNILNATWNLLRRAAAGRSDADVKALASAQGELRQRTIAATQGRGRRGAGAESREPMAQAAAAMARAQDALQRERLQDAVPHEMEALTQLGRALAENRRREVSQQRGGGGGGGNRSSQDLSSLFDRELLRQQQTNYENRQSSSSEQRGEAESDLQKRIRELAQRQDELARAQRQLAQQRLAEEERRRQLERLTREQEELRREAEQLARDLQRSSGGSSRQSQQQQREQSESLREAAEDMRAATGELRRNDAQSASERGGRAAERLRGAERSASAGGGQPQQPQSLGELQMEAQQLSEAQRRVEQQSAAEPQTGNRQLAEEQGRLAERTERLERSARGVAGATGDQRQRQAAAQAARDLQRERVAERMRENAQRLQRGGGAERQERPAPQQGAGRPGEQEAQPSEGTQSSARPQQGSQGARPGEQQPRPGQGAQPGEQQPHPAQTGQSGEQHGAQGSRGGQPQSPASGQLSSTLDRIAERLGEAGDAETRRIANEMARNRAAREQLEQTARRLERAQREGDTRAQEELRRELQRAEQMMRQLQEGGSQDAGLDGTTPEQHEWSRSAPGLESFKQDFTRWEQLKRDITLALERRDLSLARRLGGHGAQDKVSAGSVEGLPEAYREKVAKYFEALARAGRRPPAPEKP